jgi:cytochrome P450
VTAPPPWTDEGRQDPMPWYRQMRARSACADVPELGVAMLFGHDAVRSALMDDETFSIERRIAMMPARQRRVSNVADTLVGLDPPEHTRLRRLVTPAFRQAAVRAMRPRIEAISRDLFDAALPRGEFDFVDAYARPLTETVIAEQLGIPAEHRDLYTHLSIVLERAAGKFVGETLPEDQLAETEVAYDTYAEFTEDVIAERRANPRADLISDLIRAVDETDQLSWHELLKMTILLNVAGAVTTQTLIAITVVELARHPQAWELLKQRRELIPNAVDEVLRFHGTSQSISRVTTRDTEIDGCPIPAGSTVLLGLQSANRDPAVFPDPDTFDVTRPAGRHMAFGFGTHYCLGAALAKTETAVFLEQWLDRVDSFSCPPDPLDWARRRLTAIVLDSLPVRVELVA